MNKNNLIRSILLIIVILVVITVAIKVYKWESKPKTDEHTQSSTKTDENGDYLKKRDQHITTPKRLANKVDTQDIKYKEIDRYLKNITFNGSIAVYENGKLKMNKGYDYQNIDEDIKNSANTMYLIGSSQKFMTGLMLKQLELEHKVNINDSVTKYIPWMKTSKPITLKDLMLHRSGLYKFHASTKDKNLDQAVKAIQKRGIDPEKYHKHMYNDGNYLVLAKVIEEVTHQSYAKNYYKRLGDPFKLKHTAFYNEKPFQADFAKGYKITNNGLTPQIPKILDQYYGAGNLYMTPSDMGKLIYKVQQYKLFNSEVTNPLLHELGTEQYPEEYRYGFYVKPTVNRVNGVFYGQIFTAYFNNNYIIVLANNMQENNESKIKHIYANILGQTAPYNQQGITVQ